MTPLHLVTMGVCGTGKSTIAERLAGVLGLELIEGDSFHPPQNIAKMSAGTPLTDCDRLPWLQTLASLVRERHAAGVGTVLTCSALRRRYRDILRSGAPEGTYFIHLHGDFDLLAARMRTREHFMPTSLLRSQFDTLEQLEPDEAGSVVDVSRSVDDVLTAAVEAARATVLLGS